MAKKLISICIPVMNEVDNIDLLLSSLSETTKTLKKYRFEYVFSDNYSIDGTWEKILKHSNTNKRIKGIRFSKNIGYQNSILQNYYYSTGEALIQLDADLQDPPALIINFLNEWEKGYKVVYGIRKTRKGSQINSLIRRIGYKALAWSSNSALHNNVGDFRLIDKSVVQVLKQRNYTNPYLRGVISSLGFKEIGITYERDVRIAGESKFNAAKVIKLGLIGLLSFSTKPIRIFIPLSLFFLFLSIFGVFWVLFLNLTENDLPKGFSATQIFIFISIGINSLFAAIAGDYLHKIYKSLHPSIDGHILENI
jgi:glycosyltransferase involved in cell wall biosynthesis